MKNKINIAIIGASGYTGAELLRFLLTHPHANIAALSGDSQAGKPIEEVYPHLRLASQSLPPLVKLDAIDFSTIDLVFCCLPHGTTQEVIANLPTHVKIIDLSADFRLFDEALYEQWYGHAHCATDLQKEAVYGLSEHARDDIKKARLIANPGCYPTSVLLPLLPLIHAKDILPEGIIIDAKSGITGAGRNVRQGNLFAEIDGGISAYSVASHRHAPEIEQSLGWVSGSDVCVSFTPHLMPMNRGILSTIYVKLAEGKTATDIRNTLEKAYASETFVHVLPEGAGVSTHQVRGTNHCIMNVFADRAKGQAIIVSVIDNLVKGAAGQAIQNMNIMFDWPENTGLTNTAVFP